jgi:hypothetical protein
MYLQLDNNMLLPVASPEHWRDGHEDAFRAEEARRMEANLGAVKLFISHSWRKNENGSQERKRRIIAKLSEPVEVIHLYLFLLSPLNLHCPDMQISRCIFVADL